MASDGTRAASDRLIVMALQSELFGGDAQLEAAAVSDGAHIKLGARGAHVGKLQLALIELDGASIDTDSSYGPATAAAVLAYKKKRGIINRSYQSQADNIVGKMTMAALDKEMLEREQVPAGPIRIRPVNPGPSGIVAARTVEARSTLRLAFSFNASIDPNLGNALGPFTKIRLAPRTTGKLEIVRGKGGVITCNNELLAGGIPNHACHIFDSADTNPPIRLVDEPRGPLGSLSVGGDVQITSDPQSISVDAYRPGNAFVHASNAKLSSVHTVAIEVRAPKLSGFPGQQTQALTATRPNSKFLSAKGQDSSVPGGFTGGRPVNPKNIPGRRKINLGGEGESPGFEDYTPSLAHSGFKNNVTTKQLFRPWTEDPDAAVFVPNGAAGDICIRGIPLDRGPDNINVLKRIAGPGCRITLSGSRGSVQALKQAFPFKPIEEFPEDDEVVIELP
jgi:hypothetical protein